MTKSRTRKISSLLDIPVLYQIFQWLIGASSTRQIFVDKYLRPVPGCSILDIGCGPADILQYLPPINYVGFDINRKCIEAARRGFGDKGTFFHKSDCNLNIEKKESFDIVMATGVLHHLDDNDATELLRFGLGCMKPGGRLVTIDGCYTNEGSRLEHFILSRDRGSFVRTEEEYFRLAIGVFKSVKVFIHTDLLRIPYTHIVMECE